MKTQDLIRDDATLLACDAAVTVHVAVGDHQKKSAKTRRVVLGFAG